MTKLSSSSFLTLYGGKLVEFVFARVSSFGKNASQPIIYGLFAHAFRLFIFFAPFKRVNLHPLLADAFLYFTPFFVKVTFLLHKSYQIVTLYFHKMLMQFFLLQSLCKSYFEKM
jgi:hypothetical protein